MTNPILISNSFPFALVRREMTAMPMPLSALQECLRTRPFVSAWGHANTLQAAHAIVGVDLTPQSERPALTLSAEQLPSLDGQAFTECWLLSPEYKAGFRPKINEEVPAEAITGWQALRLMWK